MGEAYIIFQACLNFIVFDLLRLQQQ